MINALLHHVGPGLKTPKPRGSPIACGAMPGICTSTYMIRLVRLSRLHQDGCVHWSSVFLVSG